MTIENIILLLIIISLPINILLEYLEIKYLKSK